MRQAAMRCYPLECLLFSLFIRSLPGIESLVTSKDELERPVCDAALIDQINKDRRARGEKAGDRKNPWYTHPEHVRDERERADVRIAQIVSGRITEPGGKWQRVRVAKNCGPNEIGIL